MEPRFSLTIAASCCGLGFGYNFYWAMEFYTDGDTSRMILYLLIAILCYIAVIALHKAEKNLIKGMQENSKPHQPWHRMHSTTRVYKGKKKEEARI